MRGKDVVYRGKNRGGQRIVTVNGRKLPIRMNEVRHSPSGFAWGYAGSGPAQLAYAILRDFLGQREQAMRFYQQFKTEVVARIPLGEDWEMTGEQVMGTDTLKEIVAREVMEA